MLLTILLALMMMAGLFLMLLSQNGIDSPDVAYGCSMGGSVVLRMIADGKVQIKNAVLDGGITPYNAPWILTRWIALKGWVMMGVGKAGGIELLEKAFAYMSKHFPNTEYIEMEGLGHAGMATLRPDDFAQRIINLLN